MKPTRFAATRPAFTLMELMVTIAVILILIGLLTVGINGALRMVRRSGERQMATALKTAVEEFRNELGFVPPLVKDGRPLFDTDNVGPIEPVPGKPDRFQVSIWGGDDDPDYEDFLTGRTSEGTWRDDADRRYSKFSLPYYLMGACDVDDGSGKPIDGERGGSFRKPRADGLFDHRQRAIEALYSPREGSLVRNYADIAEFREHGLAPSGNDLEDAPEAKSALVDRNGRAVRYYRWKNGAATTGLARGEYMNIPKVLQDPVTRGDANASAADDEPELAGATYAIVMAGPDGLFGTEDIEDFVERYGDGVRDQDIDAIRRKAWRDNIVEVGK